MKMARKLWEKYPFEDFWSKKKKEEFPSLAYYLTGKGLVSLDTEFRLFGLLSIDISSSQSYDLSESKIGEDLEIKPAPFKTLKDFLNG